MGRLNIFLHPKMALMLVLGFSAGLPFLLYFSVLSVRLENAGIEPALIGFFSWFGLSYSLKFIWAPIVDKWRPPVLADMFGQRPAWIFIAQTGVACGLVGMGMANPVTSLGALALFSFLTAFASATQDIGIDAWRIEAAANDDEQAPLAAAYQYGYRAAMMVAGGAALTFAGFANWTLAYFLMAGLIMLAAAILLLTPRRNSKYKMTTKLAATIPGLGYAAILFGTVLALAALIGAGIPLLVEWGGLKITKSHIGWMATWTAAMPFLICTALIPWIRSLPENHRRLNSPITGPAFDIFRRYGWSALLLLLFVSCYRLSDIVLGVMAKASYSHIGYQAEDIGLVSGFFGPWPPLLGVAMAGIAAIRFGLAPTLAAGAILSVAGNLTFVWLMGQSSASLTPLFIAVTADNIAAGFAGTAFIAFMSGLTSHKFCASQYALFSSMFTLAPKLIAGTSGLIVEHIGYAGFFAYAAAMGVPAIILAMFIGRFAISRAKD